MTRKPVPTPGQLGGISIFEAKRQINWDTNSELAKAYVALTDSIGAIASKLGVAVTVPQDLPPSLTMVSSRTLRETRRLTGNGDFSREVIAKLKETAQQLPTTIDAQTSVIGLPSFTKESTPEDDGTLTVRITGSDIKAEQSRLFGAVAEVSGVDLELPHLDLSVANISTGDWQTHAEAFMHGVDRSVLHMPITLGRFVTPTHVGAA